jgi:hypothetical protein
VAVRRTARPRPGRRLPAALAGAKLQTRTRPARAAQVETAAATGSLAELARHKRHVLVTFRRDGRAVPTPLWAAVAGGAAYVRSERAAGKVKRLRRDPRALIAPCDARGVAIGPPLAVRGRLLPAGAPEEAVAERALARRYGLGRAAFELIMDLLRVDMGYLELVPDQS